MTRNPRQDRLAFVDAVARLLLWAIAAGLPLLLAIRGIVQLASH